MFLIFQFICIIILTGSFISLKAQNYTPYSSLLSDYVREGKVDYENLCADDLLGKSINSLRNLNKELLKNQDDSLAFWINIYNAYTLKIVCDNYPVESIVDIGWGGLIIGHVLGTSVWDKKFVKTESGLLSLNDIEHDIIRKKFNDPRIHFALVCASESCPPLLNEAYNGENLNIQLHKQALKFLNDSTRNRFDLKNRKALLSSIFDWYRDDFANDEEGLLLFIAEYLPDEIKSDILTNSGKWSIKYLNYDWSLNDSK
ncbi:MAG: DUF547 domain-containing protein [Ignavibacteriaceae bacterium]